MNRRLPLDIAKPPRRRHQPSLLDGESAANPHCLVSLHHSPCHRQPPFQHPAIVNEHTHRNSSFAEMEDTTPPVQGRAQGRVSEIIGSMILSPVAAIPISYDYQGLEMADFTDVVLFLSSGRTTAWIGAGPSVEMGLPTWKGLAAKVLVLQRRVDVPLRESFVAQGLLRQLLDVHLRREWASGERPIPNASL